MSTSTRDYCRAQRATRPREEGSPANLAPTDDLPQGDGSPGRRAVETQQIVRQTAVGRSVKNLHAHRCQVCGIRLETPAGPYAEAAHIRPLGRPHDGPDTSDNVLCLCPNDHVLFDKGAISIASNLSLLGREGSLSTVDGHEPAAEHLEYHREHVYDS